MAPKRSKPVISQAGIFPRGSCISLTLGHKKCRYYRGGCLPLITSVLSTCPKV
nr:MAG TPA: hypothetical protein [Caudoviricetes sp.]